MGEKRWSASTPTSRPPAGQRPRSGDDRQCGSRISANRRLGPSWQLPLFARPHLRPAQGAGDRHARRLFDHLHRSRPAGGWQKHADVARVNIARVALDSLPTFEAEGRGPFEFIFIDADRGNNANYLAWTLRLSRPETVIVVDNVVRSGAIVEAVNADRTHSACAGCST